MRKSLSGRGIFADRLPSISNSPINSSKKSMKVLLNQSRVPVCNYIMKVWLGLRADDAVFFVVVIKVGIDEISNLV